MDGNKRARGAEKAAAARSVPPAAPSDDADATSAPARVVRKTLPVPGAAAPPPPVDDDEPVAAVDDRGAGAGVVEDDDDEQVERFYALLENIRAMRGMLGATAAGRKRAREAEPPWRPAFRMEDFELDEVQSDAPCSDAKRESSRGAGRPPAAAGRETTDDDEGGEGEEVVEVKCPRRPQHKARRRAGVLAVDRLGSR